MTKNALIGKEAYPSYAHEVKQDHDKPVGEAYLCDKCSTPFDGAWECPSCDHNTSTKEPVYTTPQQRKPLRDEMLKQMKESCDSDNMEMRGAFIDGWTSAEAAHGIKE